MKLVESFKTSPVNNENNKIKVESVLLEGKKVNCLGVYTFPISRPNETNLNERIYTSKLWENVIKNKMGENSYGLMDHPVDEGSVKDRFCVWKDIRFSEDKKLILADAYLFGSNGQEVMDGLEAGGSVGLSTVGYGDFKKDKKTIDESSYELDRVADFVLNPSYQVFGTSEDIKKEQTIKEADTSTKSVINYLVKKYPAFKWLKKDVGNDASLAELKKALNSAGYGSAYDDAIEVLSESTIKEAAKRVCENCGITILPEIAAGEKCPGCENIWDTKEKVTTKATENTEEKQMDSKVKSFQERTFETQIKSYMKQADAMELVTERLDQYVEILSYLDEDSELKTEVSIKIIELKKEFSELAIKGTKVSDLTEAKQTLEEKITETETKLNESIKELENLSEKYDVSVKMLDNTKYYANKMKELYRTQKASSNGMATAKEYNESLKYIEDLEKQLAESRLSFRDLKKENADLIEKVKLVDFKEQNLKDIATKAEADETERLEAKKVQDDKDAVIAEEKRVEESISIWNSDDVKEYYEDLYKVNNDVKVIKEDILKCKTVFEAQNTYLRLKDLFEESSFDSRRDITSNLKEEEYSFNKERKFVIEEAPKSRELKRREGWV